MKAAPVLSALRDFPEHFKQILVHTGQHYDDSMSRVFFDELGIGEIDEHLCVGSGSHAEQTARVMLLFEPALLKHKPDWVVVYGDVNSTIACALVAAKLHIPVAHVEAGLRSGDRTMPEEINRVLTDQISSLLFTPSADADANLKGEGIDPSKIHLVGNVMIDTLAQMIPKVTDRTILSDLGLERCPYILATLHRPSNVDNPAALSEILGSLSKLAETTPVIFPVHPRTKANIQNFEIKIDSKTLKFLDPLGYMDFLALTKSASLVITDSGGMQEESTYLGVPCLTVRPNTERPVTIQLGTNQLVESRMQRIIQAATKALAARKTGAVVPPFWDGHAAKRIAQVLMNV
jgi:UDP-N-acetylglucosamine 2-epimerase (non-hydrolysing)